MKSHNLTGLAQVSDWFSKSVETDYPFICRFFFFFSTSCISFGLGLGLGPANDKIIRIYYVDNDPGAKPGIQMCGVGSMVVNDTHSLFGQWSRDTFGNELTFSIYQVQKRHNADDDDDDDEKVEEEEKIVWGSMAGRACAVAIACRCWLLGLCCVIQ